MLEKVSFRSSWPREQIYLETFRASVDVAGCGPDVETRRELSKSKKTVVLYVHKQCTVSLFIYSEFLYIRQSLYVQ